eukprot:Rhum_TRINITY_DN3248_c0_g1::Rhum_TRINITY_DN3248_c0_g1_i1::g.10028::m.10028
MARRVVEGAGLETSNDGFDFNTLRKIAQFCQRLMAESKPTKDAIEKCRSMAENVGNVEVVAGAITRHIKFSSGSKQLLCWYLLDSLSKTHPDTFCLSFGPQVQELAIHHMNWLNPKDELKYSKLVDTWKTLFGLRVCEEILRGKEVRKAEHELEEKEKAERKAKGEPEEEEQAKKQWDTKEMIIGRVEDGQVMERIAPCKYYLLGICNSANCTQPHPPGLFGSINPKKIFGDWVCLKCGFKNVGSRVKCWRNECTGVKPEHNGINLQSLQKNPLKEQFGYDIGWGDEEDEKGNEPAVEHYSNTNWEQYRAERVANYKGLWTRWSNTRRKLDPSFADRDPAPSAGQPCHQCSAPLKVGAAFCTQCGTKQAAAAAPAPAAPQPTEEGEREDLLFPSTRVSQPEVPCSLSAAVSELVSVCRNIVNAYDPQLLDKFLQTLQQCKDDPTFQQLPQERSSIILRAISTGYSKWAAHKSPNDRTPDFLQALSSMRELMPLQNFDESVFNSMVAETAPFAFSSTAAAAAAPSAGAGTITL